MTMNDYPQPPPRRKVDEREIVECPDCGQKSRVRNGRWYRHRNTEHGPYAWCNGPRT